GLRRALALRGARPAQGPPPLRRGRDFLDEPGGHRPPLREDAAPRPPEPLGLRLGEGAMSETPRIWAPWRAAYLKGEAKAPGGCLFCVAQDPSPASRREWLVLAVGRKSLVMLNHFPYTGGHLMVAPRAHAASLEDLPEEDHDDLFRAVRESLRLLKA